MKTTHAGILIIIAALTAAPASAELIKNGDFESVSGTSVSDWKIDGKDAVVEASPNGGFISGTYSVYIKSASDDPAVRAGAGITQPVAVEPGASYTLVFYARGEKDGQILRVFHDAWRAVGAHWYRQKEISLTKEWKKYTVEESIPGAEEWDNRKLSIRFSVSYGSCFIDNVSMTPAVKASFAVPSRRNILENPGFDDGVSGWFAESWNPSWSNGTERMERDTAVKHSGRASLKLHERRTSLVSRRYQFKPDTAYTMSFSMKSDDSTGEGVNAFVITPHWKIAKTEITPSMLSREWKRYTVAFKAASLGNAYANSCYIRIDARSTVWIDSFQFEEGPATEYDPGVQAGIEPAVPSGIFQKNTPAAVVLSARNLKGSSGPHVLTLMNIGPDGSERWVRTVEVTGDSSSAAVTIPSDMAGVVDLSLTLTARAAPKNVLASAEWRAVIIDGDLALPPNPYFGLDTAPAWSPMASLLSEEELASGFGAGMGRSFFSTTSGWPVGLRTNTSVRNPEHIAVLREAYGVLSKAGKSVMIVFDAGRDNPLTLRYMSRNGKLIPIEEREAAIPEFASRMALWVTALSNVLDVAEIFNEPNIWIVGGEKGMPPELYVNVLAAVHKAVRAVNTSVKLAANINGIDFEYTQKFLALGGANYIDVFTVHPYRTTAENPPLYEDYRRLRAVLDKAKPGIPVVNSEQYYGVRNPIYQGEYDRNYFSDSEEDQAGRLLQTSLHGIAADRIPFCIFAPGALLAKEGISESRYFYHYFGMLRTLSSLVRDVTQGDTVASDRSLRVFLFEKNDGTKVVTANTRTFGVKGTVAISLKADAAYDANGNKLDAGAVPVRYVPSYWVFGKSVRSDDIRRAFATAVCRGFDFPVELTASTRSDGKLAVQLKNVSTTAAHGNVKITRSPDIWSFPSSIAFDIPAGGAIERAVDPSGTPAWNAQYALTYTAQSDELIINRTLRLPSLSIPKARTPITVDGDLSDWDAPWIVLDEHALSKNFNEKPHQGSADLKARLALRWDNGGLYLAVQVRDDVVVHKGNPSLLYESDSVQVYFDLGNNALDGVNAYDKDDVCYAIGLDKNTPVAYLEKNPGMRYVGENNAETGIDPEVKVSYRAAGDGYIIEAFFPSFTLPFLALKSGSVMGISLIVNDNDGSGRKQGLTLGPKGTEPFSSPFLWRCAELKE